MSISFGFYNSSNHDRRYDARQISRLFNALIKDGVFMHIGSHFAVTEGSGMTVNVGTGYAWFNSTWTLNDSPFPITPEESDLLLTRIDAVVLEVNEIVNSRTNSIKFVKGTPSANPQKPTLTNTNDIHQYALAYVTIAPGAESLSQANIENNVGMESCPFVTGILETIDISSLISQWETQWNEWLNQQKQETDEFQKTSEEEFTSWSNERKQEITNFQESSEASFLAWFEKIKDKLGEDPAGKLQNQIDDLNAAITGYPLKLTAGTNSLQITAKRNSVESVKVEGFTKDGKSGGLRMAMLSINGSENWNNLSGVENTQYLALSQYNYTENQGGDRVLAFCNLFPRVPDSAPSDNPPFEQFSAYVRAADKALVLKVNAGFSTAEELKQFFSVKQPNFWIFPPEESQATGLYIPIEIQGHKYRCQCLPITEALAAGDNVQSNVSSGCDQALTLNGGSGESWQQNGLNGAYNLSIENFPLAIENLKAITNYLPQIPAVQTYAGQVGFSLINSSRQIQIRLEGGASPASYLPEHPLSVYFQTSAYNEQSDIPVELETHASRVLVLDGTNAGLQMDTLNNNRILLPLPDAKPDQLPSSDKYIGKNSNDDKSAYIDNGFTPALGIVDSRFTNLETAKSVLASDPATVVYELKTPVSYAHDPVAIPTDDGSTIINAPEDCTLEVSVSRNEAKTFKATLLMSAWSGSSGNYMQTAEVKCIDGPGFVSSESSFDSVLWVNQTENLDTNEKLVEALSIINLGYITLGDGTITCKVAEKPTCDIEIRFKALR